MVIVMEAVAVAMVIATATAMAILTFRTAILILPSWPL